LPNNTPSSLQLTALTGMPLVEAGDDIAGQILVALGESNVRLEENDVLVVAQKIVSKAEGRLVYLDQVTPSEEAQRRASETDKDPRLVELILRESVSVVRQERNLLITENKLGIVMANAGIDQSNVESGCALLLPEDPDQSATILRTALKSALDIDVGIVIADSIGRAWRRGIIGHAIGVAGVEAVIDMRETYDLYGRELRVTEIAIADEIAAAGTLLMGQAQESIPVVIVRGFSAFDEATSAKELIRPKDQDLFR
jgi:coenzyme F420-0:L-glutamate ligase / coenzyme F420-1:gamma-L-glutamate ligase